MDKSITKIGISLILLAFLAGCGGGGGSSSSSSSTSSSTSTSSGSSVETGSVADNYQALTLGDPASFTDATSLAGLLKRYQYALFNGKFSLISNANASVSPCATSTKKILGAKSNNSWEALSVLSLDRSAGISTDDGASDECITNIQDGVNYLAFVADNLKDANAKCEINLVRKRDSKVFCINTGIPALLGSSSTTKATYEVGGQSSIGTEIYDRDYSLNSSGYKSVATRNGRYLFSRFTITVGGRNYIGITRLTLSTRAAPTSKVVWLKELTVTGATESYNLRGFIGLESGDLVVDYVQNYNPNGLSDLSSRPLAAATREYIAVNSDLTGSANHPSFVLWQGYDINNYLGLYKSEGALLNALYATDYVGAKNTSNAPVISYVSGASGNPPTLYSITSDPSSTARVIYVKTGSGANNNRAGPQLDLFKVTIAANSSGASIDSVSYIGPTSSYYPIAIIGEKIYSWDDGTYYSDTSGGSVQRVKGVYSHSINGTSTTDDVLVRAVGSTFTYSVYATRSSLFVIEGFGGYFGGTIQGTNYIHQVAVSGGIETFTTIDVGQLALGTFTKKLLTVNPVTEQIQMGGTKKANMSDYSDSTRWSAFISADGVRQLRIYSTLSALSDSTPVLSMKDGAGRTPSYSD